MRKFSKKIAMMMVLAMLVSMFSGIVSASAASIWSAKSVDDDNYAVVMGETIEVKKGEFINFDLFKADEEATEAGYEYTWESSDEEVIFIGNLTGKNGYARVKGEVGDEATISATFTNLETGKSATRSFDVVVVEELTADAEYDIIPNFDVEEAFVVGEEYELDAVVTADGEEIEADIVFTIDDEEVEVFAPAEAGEVTIVATVVIDGEEYAAEFVCEVIEATPAEIVEAKQVALDAVELVMNDAAWAAKAAADNAIAVAQVMGGVDVAELVKSVAVKKDADDTVVVTLYNNIKADATYKFAYGEVSATVVGAGNTPAKIVVVGGAVPANVIKQAKVKVYNTAGIEITNVVTNTVTYSVVGENNDVDVQADGSVYFFEKGKNAAIKAVLDMGWDNEGNELTDIEATGSFYSVDEFTYTGLQGYALSIDGKAAKDLTYGNATLKLSLSDTGRKVLAKYEKVPYEGDKVALYVEDGDAGTYTYHTTNGSVVLVDEATGVLYPCSEGYASIYLKKGDAVVGSVSVNVQGARKLGTLTATIADNRLATKLSPADSTQISVATKDQFGEAYNNVTYTLTLDTPIAKGSGKATMEDLFVVGAVADGKITLTLAAGATELIKAGNVQTIAFTVKANDDLTANNAKTQKLTVSIRNNVAYTGNKVSTLTVSTGEIDVALNKKNLSDYAATIKLVNVDDKGYDLGLEDIAFEAVATTGSVYSVVVTKVGDNNFNATTSKYFTVTGNVISINPVVDATDKLATGTYKVQLYKRSADGLKMQAIKSATIQVKDSTPSVTAVVKTDKLTNIADVLEFYINGAKVDTANIVNVQITDEVNNIAGKTYVRKVKVTLKSNALNKDSALGLTFDKEVAIGQLFTLQ